MTDQIQSEEDFTSGIGGGLTATEYAIRVGRGLLHPNPARWDDIEADSPGTAKQGRRDDETRRLEAVAFAEGGSSSGALQSYMGPVTNRLATLNLIDWDAVRTALAASNAA